MSVGSTVWMVNLWRVCMQRFMAFDLDIQLGCSRLPGVHICNGKTQQKPAMSMISLVCIAKTDHFLPRIKVLEKTLVSLRQPVIVNVVVDTGQYLHHRAAFRLQTNFLIEILSA